MADVNIYTAGRLSGMARSLGLLARSCLDGIEGEKGLTREDAQSAMQMARAMVCGDCSRCNLYSSSEKSDSYYLYYLLHAFEQKGQVDEEDMPRLFLEACRRKEDYMAQLNRNLGRASMNLEWKNRFLESRDTVMVQFRELAVILDEFAHQMERATDVTQAKEETVRRKFHLHRIAVENMLLLEYENHQREAYLTVHALGRRCVTAKEAAELFGEVVGGNWYEDADQSTECIDPVCRVRAVPDAVRDCADSKERGECLRGQLRLVGAGTWSGDFGTLRRDGEWNECESGERKDCRADWAVVGDGIFCPRFDEDGKHGSALDRQTTASGDD